MKSKPMKKAFTLAEIMIVLTIIGVLTAILLPIANHSRPDEAVMKFKKANTTLANVIRELVNSDKYYADGDLGMRSDGTFIDGKHNEDYKYFCQTFAEIISTKNLNCSDSSGDDDGWIGEDWMVNGHLDETSLKQHLDKACKNTQVTSKVGAEITTTDGIIFYQTNPQNTFGVLKSDWATPQYPYYRTWNGKDTSSSSYSYSLPGTPLKPGYFYYVEKIFCIDVDGLDKGEDPFGYGIRVDGKIMTGARADEWLEKGFQKGSNEN